MPYDGQSLGSDFEGQRKGKASVQLASARSGLRGAIKTEGKRALRPGERKK